jgi:hypothetical protein
VGYTQRAANIVRWVLVLRLFGLVHSSVLGSSCSPVVQVRILSNFNAYTILFETMKSLDKFLPRLLMSVGVIYIFYGLVGMQFFGGKIYEGAPALNGTDYEDNGEFACMKFAALLTLLKVFLQTT